MKKMQNAVKALRRVWRRVMPVLRFIGRVCVFVGRVIALPFVWMADLLYPFHYNLGVYVLRRLRRFGRFISRITDKPRRLLRYAWLSVAVRPVHRFFRSVWRTIAGFPLAYRGMGAALKKNVFSIFLWLPRGFVRWLRNYSEGWFSIGRLLGPVAAVTFLVSSLQIWQNTEFCLMLSYHGTELGAIANSSVYDEAASMVRRRVTNEDDSFEVDMVPTLTMVVRGGRSLMTASQVCDAILLNSGSEIAEATGLYIDGVFEGAVEDEAQLEALLEEMKAAVQQSGDDAEGDDAEDSTANQNDPLKALEGLDIVEQRVEFVQDVHTETGYFPISTVKSVDQIREQLTHQTVVEKIYTVQAGDVFSRIALKHDMTSAELRALNPQIENTNRLQIGDELVVQRPQTYLQVKMVVTVLEEDVPINFSTQTTYNSSVDEGVSKTLVKGQKGAKDVTTEITFVDGFESERVVVDETVTKQPVTQKVEVGTKKVAPMLWPVPVCRNVYQGYHSGHLAIDISSGPTPVFRQPALAADAGTVIQASTGWNGGYGTVVKVRHSNGLITVYAHLDSLSVSVGQRVYRGQMVGRIGNTGRSFGPHLHFEVIRNGVKVNPLNYVKPY